MDLQTLWFVLIAVLWTGYLILEGFDFGVGTLLHVVGRTESERGQAIRSIAPVWDGNEVWLLVAGGATFAAFPEWYATLFSGFYLALTLILVSLIVLTLLYAGLAVVEVWLFARVARGGPDPAPQPVSGPGGDAYLPSLGY